MKKLFTILALIASIFAVIFSVLPISNLAIFPAIAALIFGSIAYYLSKKAGHVKKIIPFTLLLTGAALVVTTYKSIFTKTEVVEAKETKLEEASIEELEELDIELDETELEDISFE